MSEVATAECDGCTEQRPVQQLDRITLPSGQTVVCCPDCRYHAEKLAATETASCEGCGTQVSPVDLTETPMPDGQDLQLCPDCLGEAAGLHGVDAENGRSPGGAGTGAGQSATGSAGGEASGAAGSGASAAGTDGGVASTSGADASASATARDASATDEPEGRTGKPATTESVCDQCGEFFSIELYKVKTVDGRTELFCPDCKDQGVREGLVRDVELRRAQAYEVLELGGDASEAEIRDAYLEKVKQVHPDRADGNRSEFMLVKQAYERLSEE